MRRVILRWYAKCFTAVVCCVYTTGAVLLVAFLLRIPWLQWILLPLLVTSGLLILDGLVALVFETARWLRQLHLWTRLAVMLILAMATLVYVCLMLWFDRTAADRTAQLILLAWSLGGTGMVVRHLKGDHYWWQMNGER